MDEAAVFDELEEGDRILFNDKKLPLTVTEIGEERMFVEGPHGGEYVIYRSPDDEDVLLYATRGNRRYSSRVEDLRTVGQWKRDGDTWRHTVSDAEIRVVETETGFWMLELAGIDPDRDLPLYGFAKKEAAVEEAAKIVADNPEG
ncbi:MAG: hypothetical protein SV186_04045 [Candidatus Nanohaloarchaea archaeon]|nr:hypothetical protein [Candidatus Nanohaloarchaea archaeon]